MTKATPNQINYLKSLFEKKAHTYTDDQVAVKVGAAESGRMSKSVASNLISSLVALPWKPKPAPSFTRVEPGFYVVGDEIYKVQPSRSSDRTYAKQLVIDRQLADSDDEDSVYTDDVRWEYRPGVLGKIAKHGRRLTLEEAKEFGRTHGYCCVCARLLTNEESVAAGIGPICASKF